MYELNVSVTKVLGTCSSDVPMQPGVSFSVRDGDIRIPPGGSICMWALQSLMPLLTTKEREIAEAPEDDWVWRVHHAQCPDPAGRVIWKLERTGKVGPAHEAEPPTPGPQAPLPPVVDGIRSLRVVVEEVRGTCTSGMAPGDSFTLLGSRIVIPAHRHFCLYALQAVLPLLPPKQRPLQEGDWLRDEAHVICPDPKGNVIMRIEPLA